MTTTKRAIISVSDKTGVVAFARGLLEAGVELVASGGTARVLEKAGLPVTTVEALTGLPSILGGRVKTLHPALYAGILARSTEEDMQTLKDNGWGTIDFVVVNLYPFEETVARPDVSHTDAVESIDIGGVSLIRAAAKNAERVTVVVTPEDYDFVLDELKVRGETSQATRDRLAFKAFQRTAAYDSAIGDYMQRAMISDPLPAQLTIALPKAMDLRYGENPHQEAVLYAVKGAGPLGGELLQGKPLSYNNLLDIDAAWRAAADFGGKTIVIVKHLSPCGIAQGDTLAEAFKAALACDPDSAFGGVIAAADVFDEDVVKALGDLFVEAIAAPGFTGGAREALAGRKNCRLLAMRALPAPAFEFRTVRGGVLAQTLDADQGEAWRVVSERQPTDAQVAAMRFAWRAATHVKSNAIVLAQGRAAVGIGGGLPSRVDATHLAVTKAGDRAKGAVLASDAFFPFPDAIEAAAKAGVVAAVEPGGSTRDADVIAAANKLGVALVFTGVRHFRH
ncbi:MAG: bifunctional phosphoribosylaminoimidazolecarboxamide formyltransferase/IMP cyclohydrolase [Anaerolineae bacterium]|nr:bifunctional phosphoribosylaminoimidazolecarboxamide formyltransferase/IMP cyclohydrolase [Anaerolineae bacterium]